MYVLCDQQLPVAFLRRSNPDGSKPAWAVWSLLVNRLREAWPGVRIVFRGDPGYCRRRIASAAALGTSWGWPAVGRSNPRRGRRVKWPGAASRRPGGRPGGSPGKDRSQVRFFVGLPEAWGSRPQAGRRPATRQSGRALVLQGPAAPEFTTGAWVPARTISFRIGDMRRTHLEDDPGESGSRVRVRRFMQYVSGSGSSPWNRRPKPASVPDAPGHGTAAPVTPANAAGAPEGPPPLRAGDRRSSWSRRWYGGKGGAALGSGGGGEGAIAGARAGRAQALPRKCRERTRRAPSALPPPPRDGRVRGG